MHLAIDLDDVILDFAGGVTHAMQVEYDVNVELDDWDLSGKLNPIIGYSWWTWLKQRDWLWPNFPAIPGAIGALGVLRKEGHYLEIVTSKPEWAEYSVWKWLGKWRPPVNRVTIMDTQTQGGKSEWTAAELLIDDRNKNCQEFLDNGRDAILFMGQAAYKKTHHDWHGTRAHTWAEVVDLVREKSLVNA